MNTLEQLRSLRQALPPATPDNAVLRENLMVEARALLLDLERPDNAVERICFQLIETAMVRTAVRMGLFKVINASDSSTAEDVAKACKADPVIAGRVLRCLASYGAVKQNGPDSYGPSTVSRTLAESKNVAGIETCYDLLSPGWFAMPSFLEDKKWKNPTSSTDTPLAKGWNKPDGASLWEIMKGTPLASSFNIYMATFNEGHRNWLDFYPVIERLGDGADQDPSSVMMVDVGGGHGHQAVSFKRTFPQLPGRVIVQDLPQGLPIQRAADIEYTEHNFFKEQPIKGARFYYFRYILHNWSQDRNVQICTHIRNVMKPGYSRLIIHDWVVPDVGASKLMTAMDMNMLSVLGGMERTLALHREYLEKAGLRIVKVYPPGDGRSESIIEADLL